MGRDTEEKRPLAAGSGPEKKPSPWPGLDLWPGQENADPLIGLFWAEKAPPEADLAGGLSPDETAEAEKLQGEARRLRLLSRLAAKAAAGALWQCGWRGLEIRRSPTGAPELLFDGAARAHASVSISHTRGLAAAAVSQKFRVGLDVELRSRRLSERAAGYAFTAEERFLAGAADHLLALWCAKEAAVKSWGRGLLGDLGRVRVTAYDRNTGRAVVVWSGPPGNRRAEATIARLGGHLVALAVAERRQP